jgi:PAS domain S-box-containing protein
MQAAMDCSPAGIAVADAPDGKFRYVNRAGLLIRGESAERAVKGVDIDTFVSAWQLLDFDGKPLANDQTLLARAIRHGETTQRDFMIRRVNQENRSVSASAVPIRDENGVVKAAVVVFEDITERLRVEAVLREALDVLKQRFSLQSNELDAAKVIEQALNKA